MTDDAILAEIGNRIARYRIDQQVTQADLAEQAGVSKRTVERVEAGASVQFSTVIRILRAWICCRGWIV
jgi:transcriptional regulator with XRE-family HTH domain